MLVTSPSSEMMEIVQVAKTGELLLAEAPNSPEGSSSNADAQEEGREEQRGQGEHGREEGGRGGDKVAPPRGGNQLAVSPAASAALGVVAAFSAGAVAADAHQVPYPTLTRSPLASPHPRPDPAPTTPNPHPNATPDLRALQREAERATG